MMNKKSIINTLVHSFIWGIFIFIPLLVLPEPSKYLRSNDIQLVVYIGLSFFSVLFFYFNYYFALPKMFFRKKYIIYLLSIIVFIIISISITGFIISFLDTTYCINYERRLLIKGGLIRFLFILGISLTLSYRDRYKQIEKEKIKSELSILKAQINPHFLFNTLNGIYGLAITKSDNTANSISKLASIMRYNLTEVNETKVTLEKEIKYIESYVELQKIRLTDKTKVILETKGNWANIQIEPLLFIDFIENAFKYGVSNEVETQIKIVISITNNDLFFSVFNHKIQNPNNNSSTNLGIKSTKKRLDLIYPDTYTLDIIDEDKTHEVKLIIKDL